MEIVFTVCFGLFGLVCLAGMIYNHESQLRRNQELIRYLLSEKPDELMLAEEKTKALGVAQPEARGIVSPREMNARYEKQERNDELKAKRLPQLQDLGAQSAK